MEWILDFFETTPQWIIFIILGAVVAVLVLTSLKKSGLVSAILVVVIVFMLAGIDFGELFAKFEQNEIAESVIDNEDEDKGGSLFERILLQDKQQRDEDSENLEEQDKDQTIAEKSIMSRVIDFFKGFSEE